jgi:hypothetical protein
VKPFSQWKQEQKGQQEQDISIIPSQKKSFNQWKQEQQVEVSPTIPTQPTQKKDWLQPSWYEKMANVPDEPFKLSTLGKRIVRDIGVSVPMIATGMAQWPIQAHRQTIQEGVKIPFPGGPAVVGQGPKGPIKGFQFGPQQPTQPGYIPQYLYNLAFRPGAETIQTLATPGGPKALAKSFYQHPIVGPIGTGASLALPLLLASPYVKGKMPLIPEAAKAGMISPKVPIEPSITSRLVSKAFQKFQESPRFMKVKEFAGLLPEQKAFFEQKWQYELGRSKEMANAGRSELYETIRKFTPEKKESYILNLETAKPKTPEAQALFEKANINIPELTPDVAKALDLWNKHAEEGLAYMMEATGGEIYKGAPRGRLLTQTALQRGRAEFKQPVIAQAKDLRAEVKKFGGLSEESAKPYSAWMPKELVKKNGLPLEDVASSLNMSVPDLVSGLRKFREMMPEFTKTAVEKMTTKFGYRVPIGREPGAPKGEAIAEARWQPTIQSLEAKLGTKFTIEELRDMGFEEPAYYHHAFPRDYKFRTRAYTGPSYRPGMWKERLGAKDYTREPMISIREYDYQLIKFKKLNEFKDNVVDLFGERLNPDNPMQAQIIRQGDLIKYGKGDVLYKTPEGLQIKIKENIVLPRTIANEFNKVFADPGRFEMLARATWDRGTDVWRISVLALSPRWILNNTLGNLVLNTMGGVGPGGYMDAVQMSSKAVKLMIETKRAGGKLTFDDALIKLGVPEEVAQGMYRYEAGVAQLGGTPITKGQKVIAGVTFPPRQVYKFNSAVESFYRTAHYFDKIGKGFNVADAIKSVNEFLFNYHKLTPIQRGVFRRIDPFWNWHKNIIRLAVSYPIKYPQRFLLLSYANKLGLEAYDDKLRAAGINPDNVPAYYKNMFLLPWKDEEGKDFYISLRGIDPLQDIMLGPSNLHPIIKIILERAFKTNAFTGRRFTSPYTVYGEESKAVPPLWRHVLSQFPQFRLIEDIVHPYSIYDTGEPRITKWGEPIYTKNWLLAVFGILGFKITPRDIDEIYRNLREEERAKEKRKLRYEQSLELFRNR